MRAFLALAVVMALWLAPASARAHGVNLSQSEITVDGATVRALLVFAKADAVRLGGMDPDQDGIVTPAELEASQATFRDLIEREVAVSADGHRCAPTLEGGGDVEDDGFGLSIVFACPAPPRRLAVSMDILRRLLPGHEQMLRLHAPGVDVEAVLGSREPRFEALLAEARGPLTPVAEGSPLWNAIRLGVHHILTGWDHFLFLLVVLLGTKGVRPILLAISAFTVAHSITLTMAAFDVMTPDPRLIEPAIAASIAYVALENVFRPEAPNRWRLTLAFGLVHGFGFAGALRHLALSRERLLPTLLGFNLGVELGQLLVVALLLPAMAVSLRGRKREAALVRGASLAIGALGCGLFVVRVVTRS